MKRIKFRYKDKDKYTKPGQRSEQKCVRETVRECIKFYGLDQRDVGYEIVSVVEVS